MDASEYQESFTELVSPLISSDLLFIIHELSIDNVLMMHEEQHNQVFSFLLYTCESESHMIRKWKMRCEVNLFIY